MLKVLKNINLKPRLIFVAFIFCLLLVLSVLLNSSVSVSGADSTSGSAGSADDPLVTLSYIDKVFKPQIEKIVDKTVGDKTAQFEKLIEQKVTQTVTEKLKDFTFPAATTPPSTSSPTPSEPPVNNYNTYIMSDAASSSYIVIELTKGQKLRVKEGSLEIILRPGGAADVVSQYQTQGIADLTTGDELLNGKSLPINHSLLIPRADGRGISVTSVIAYVMVRGDYEIYE